MPDLDIEAVQGGVALRAHLMRDRDPKLRRKKIADTKRRRLPIACEVCSLTSATRIGPRLSG